MRRISLRAIFTRKCMVCTLLLALMVVCGACAWADTFTFTDPLTGYELELMVIDSPPAPPLSVEAQIVGPGVLAETAKMLSGVPTSDWTYGCSATAAGMMFGYYDRHPSGYYADMYSGPANGGVAPLTDLGNQCSIIATEDGMKRESSVGDFCIATNFQNILNPRFTVSTHSDFNTKRLCIQ